MDNTGAQAKKVTHDRLKDSVILTVIMAAFLTVAGAVFWMPPADRATAGTESKSKTEKPTVTPEGKGGSTEKTGDPDVTHADVYFDFKSMRLKAAAVSTLQREASLLKKDDSWMVLLQGYADQHGPAAYNRSLAEQRAETVKQFLVELGVPEASIKVVVIGKEGAICDDPRPACQQLNRRVHLEAVRLPSAN